MMASIISTEEYQEGELPITPSPREEPVGKEARSPRFFPTVEMMLAIIFLHDASHHLPAVGS